MQPFRIDPLWHHLWQKKVSWPVVVAAFVLAEVVTGVVVAVQGDLWTGRGANAVLTDFKALVTSSPQAVGTLRVPLLQDYAGLLLLVTIPVSAGLIWKQFREATRMHTVLAENDCLEVSNAPLWRLKVESLNRSIERHGRFWYLRLLGCLGLAFVLIDSFDRDGFFAFLRSSADQPKGVLSYAHWWAAVHPFHAGFLCLEIVGGYGIYLVATQGTVGILYVRFLWRTRNIVAFRPSLTNFDGYFGWGHVRLVVGTVVGGLMAGAGSSFALYIYLHSTVGAWAVALATLSIVGLNLIILLSGILVYRSDVIAFKAGQIRKLSTMRPALTAAMTADEQSLYTLVTSEMERVIAMSNVPFRQRTVFAVVTVSLLPFIAAVLSVVQSATG